MDLTGIELPEGIAKELERLSPWNQYFKLSETCYLGRFPEILEKTGRTYCTDQDPPELIEAFKAFYENQMVEQTHQFMLNRVLKQIMGDDYSDLSIMEVGANDGMKTLHLAWQGAKQVTGTEFRKDCIDRANFISQLSGIKVDFKHIPVSLESEKFLETVEPHDVVCSYGIMHHLMDHKTHIRILRKLARKAVVFFTSCLHGPAGVETEDPMHPFKSPFGQYIVPERKKLYNYLFEEGLEMNLELKWHPGLGEAHRGDQATYMVCLINR